MSQQRSGERRDSRPYLKQRRPKEHGRGSRRKRSHQNKTRLIVNTVLMLTISEDDYVTQGPFRLVNPAATNRTARLVNRSGRIPLVRAKSVEPDGDSSDSQSGQRSVAGFVKRALPWLIPVISIVVRYLLDHHSRKGG